MNPTIITLTPVENSEPTLSVATFEEAFGEFSEARGRGRARRAKRRSDRVQKRKERRLERIGARDEVKRARRESKISRRADRKTMRQDMRDEQQQRRQGRRDEKLSRRQERKNFAKESRLNRKAMGDEEIPAEDIPAEEQGYSEPTTSEQGYSQPSASEQSYYEPTSQESSYSQPSDNTGGGLYETSYSQPSYQEESTEQGGYDDEGGGFVPEGAYEEEDYGYGGSEESDYEGFDGEEDFYGVDATETSTSTEPKANEGVVATTPVEETKPSKDFTQYNVVKGGWLFKNVNGKLVKTKQKVTPNQVVGVMKDSLANPIVNGKNNRSFVKLRRGLWIALDRLVLRTPSSFEGNDYYSAEGDVVSPSTTAEPTSTEGTVSQTPASELKPASNKTKYKVVRGGWLWRNQNGRLLKTNQKVVPNQFVNVVNETLQNPILMGKDKKRPFVKLGRGLWVALDRLSAITSNFDAEDIELGAEDYYLNAEGEKKPINPKVKEVAKKIEWNKELVSRLTKRLSEAKNPAKKEEISLTIDERNKRISELESMLGSYSNANGDRRSQYNRMAEIRRAKRLARMERMRATGNDGGSETPVDNELNPSISKDKIEIPSSSNFNGTGLNGVDLADDFDAPETRKFELNFSNVEGDKKNKKKINWTAIGIGVGAGLLLVGGILLYKKYKK